MSEVAGTIVFASACVFAYAVVQKRLSTTSITGPMIFVTLGAIASPQVLGIVDGESVEVTVLVGVLFQATLVLVLFTDAAALHFSSWREDSPIPARLLGIGLPLTIALGTACAALLLTDLSLWEAAIIGAIIAPTDAALGQAVTSNPRVPERIRQALDIESGLNDGVALPFVLIFIGLASATSDTGAVWTFVREIGVAVAVGGVVGASGGWLVSRARSAGWMSVAWGNIAVVAIAVIPFIVADSLEGSGFIAAFVAGLAFGQMSQPEERSKLDVVAADVGNLLIQLSFLAFGALILAPALEMLTWRIAAVAVLGLTVVRMGPVALSMIGARLSVPTLLYMGWFGPRGLATIVFAALVATTADLPGTGTIALVATVTVVFSVFAHGITAYPGSEAYGDWYEGQSGKVEEARPVKHTLRRRVMPETIASAHDPAEG